MCEEGSLHLGVVQLWLLSTVIIHVSLSQQVGMREGGRSVCPLSQPFDQLHIAELTASTHTCKRTHTCMRTHTYTHMHARTQRYIHASTYTHTHTSTHISTPMHAYAHHTLHVHMFRGITLLGQERVGFGIIDTSLVFEWSWVG